MTAGAKMTSSYRGKWSIQKVVATVKEAYSKSVPQVAQLAFNMRVMIKCNDPAKQLELDCKTVWHYIRHNIRYVRDTDRQGNPAEKIKVASRTLHDREGDCEDMTILAAALLANMGHRPKAVIMAQDGGGWSHIFCTAGAHPRGSGISGHVIDCVPEIPAFDAIAPKISNTMNVELLEGVALAGLGAVAPASTLTDQLIKRRDTLMEVGGIAGFDDNTRAELRKTHALILLNGTPEQEDVAALMDYAQDVTAEGWIRWQPNAPILAMQDYLEGIGAGRPRQEERKKLRANAEQEKKQGGKKPGEKLEKAAHAVLRYNPATVAVRNALLLAMKLNIFKQAEHLQSAYLTDTEAKAAGLDLGELAKLRNALRKVEKAFHVIGGKPENLKKAIIAGGRKKAKDIKGVGVVVAATASTAAASGFLASIATFLKGINLKKLFEKVNPGKIAAALGLHKADDTEFVPGESTSDSFQTDQERQEFTTATTITARESDKTPEAESGNNNTMLFAALGIAAVGFFLMSNN